MFRNTNGSSLGGTSNTTPSASNVWRSHFECYRLVFILFRMKQY
jgi:hypothetical protein